MTIPRYYYDTKPGRARLWEQGACKPIYNWASLAPVPSRLFCVVHSSDVRDRTKAFGVTMGGKPNKYYWDSFADFLVESKAKGSPCALLFVSGGGPAQGPLGVDVDAYRDDPYIHFCRTPVDQTGTDQESQALVSAMGRLIDAWEADSALNWDMLYTRWDVLLCDYLSAAALCSTKKALLKQFVDETWDAGPLIPARLERAAADLQLFGDDVLRLRRVQEMLCHVHSGRQIDGDLRTAIEDAMGIIRK